MIKPLTRAAAAVATAAAAFLLVSHTSGFASDVRAENNDKPAAAQSVPSAGLNDQTTRSMVSHGVEVTPVSTANAETKVSLEQAVTAAAGSYGFVNDGKATGAVLALITDNGYGVELEEDASKPSRIAPVLKDKLVWVVQFEGFTMPEFGALPDPKVSSDVAPAKENAASMWVAIDPETGEILRGQQIDLDE